MEAGNLQENPLLQPVAAVSVGIVNGNGLSSTSVTLRMSPPTWI